MVKEEVCVNCLGAGSIICPDCGGSGEAPPSTYWTPGRKNHCRKCQGRRKIMCPNCRGRGYRIIRG